MRRLSNFRLEAQELVPLSIFSICHNFRFATIPESKKTLDLRGEIRLRRRKLTFLIQN